MATKTWNGSNADWYTAADWSPPGVPGAGDDVIISSGDPFPSHGVGHRRRGVDGGQRGVVATVRALDIAQPGRRCLPRARRPHSRAADQAERH